MQTATQIWSHVKDKKLYPFVFSCQLIAGFGLPGGVQCKGVEGNFPVTKIFPVPELIG